MNAQRDKIKSVQLEITCLNISHGTVPNTVLPSALSV